MPLSILSLSLSGCSRSCLRQRQQRQPVNTYTHSTDTHIHPRLLTCLTALLMRCNTGLLYLDSSDPMHLLHESISNLQKANNVLSIVSVEADRPQVHRPTARQRRPPARGLHGEIFETNAFGVTCEADEKGIMGDTSPSVPQAGLSKKPPRVSPQEVALLYTACARRTSGAAVGVYIVGPTLAVGLRVGAACAACMVELTALLARATEIQFAILRLFDSRVLPFVAEGVGVIQRVGDDAFYVGKAVDTHEGVAHLFGAGEMAQIPAHMLAQLDKMVLALQLRVYPRMFQRHQQPLLACRHHIWQVFAARIDAVVQQLFEQGAILEEPGVAEAGAPDQDAMHAGRANPLRGLVETMNIAIAQNQRICLTHNLCRRRDGVPVSLALIVLH